MTDEFLTPDHEYFYSSIAQENLALEVKIYKVQDKVHLQLSLLLYSFKIIFIKKNSLYVKVYPVNLSVFSYVLEKNV